jgi:hypothetical protein
VTNTDTTERYEALRAAVLAHKSNSDRQGLALLLREGMASWAAAWNSCAALPAPSPEVFSETADNLRTFGEPTAIVALLASMVLSTLQENPS